MAPSPATRLMPPSSNGPRTPASVSKHKERHRLAAQSPSLPSSLPPSEHPVEVVGRIRDHTEGSETAWALQVHNNGQTVRVKTDQGYRDFGLDGVSLAEKEDLHSFYKKYVESRIETVKMGGRCTIMMYGPTGAGKSYTMFGSAKEPGIAYRSLEKILSGFNDQTGQDGSLKKIVVNVTILEIYNEEAFDLLATCSNINAGHWIKPSRVRVEIMGKKAKNAVSISGSDAEKISKEIAKVEKRRVVKSTLCNDRSSRSHCLVMVDVPTLGGRLVLVDMAGSENLEQAGLGTESKLQTAKINQGNIALKRVVEAIANGDSYIPFRDSKLTMLLQDSFEDDESKILMILCANTDPKDMHKTIGTLEYGSKAKCIVRLPVSPEKRKTNLDKMDHSVSEAKIQDMVLYISKLEAEITIKDKEREEMTKKLMHRDRDLFALRKVLEQAEQDHKEKCEMAQKNECKAAMERRLEECQRVADELIELGKMSLEGIVIEQQREIDTMRCRMEEIEKELQLLLKVNLQSSFTNETSVSEDNSKLRHIDCNVPDTSFTSSENAERYAEVPTNMPPAMSVRDVSEEATFKERSAKELSLMGQELLKSFISRPCDAVDNVYVQVCSADMEDSSNYLQQEMCERSGWLPTIPEESEGEGGMPENEVLHQQLQLADGIESCISKSRSRAESLGSSLAQQDGFDKLKETILDISSDTSCQNVIKRNLSSLQSMNTGSVYEHGRANLQIPDNEINCEPTSLASRRSRIENIFMLCGNKRELIATQMSAGASGNKRESLATQKSAEASGSKSKPVEEEQGHQDQSELKQAGVHLPYLTEEPLTVVTNSPTRNVTASLSAVKDPASPTLNQSLEMSPIRITPLRPRQVSTENTPPHGRSPLLTSLFSKSQISKSPRKLSFDGLSPNAKTFHGIQQNSNNDIDSCEVFVKWETSKDSCGKLIKILNMKQNATLAMLRRDVESILASDTKHDFQFLMLGDPTGAPVKRDNEAHLTVGSLPDCHKKLGSKLASLRPHFRPHFSPLTPVENQISRSASISVDVNLKSHEKAATCQIIEGALTPLSADIAMTKQKLNFSAGPPVKGLRL